METTIDHSEDTFFNRTDFPEHGAYNNLQDSARQQRHEHEGFQRLPDFCGNRLP